MKTIILATLLLTASFALAKNDLNKNSDVSVTRRGSEGVGGGDLCEDRIKTIRDDIQKWIVNGESKALQLPTGTSVEVYDREMLSQIKKAKISCVAKGDQGYPVIVQGTPKVCKFERSTSESRITCDTNKFKAMSESDQYVLVHHEYAGLADVENPDGDSSDYSISNQITGYLEDQVVKKLAIGSKVARSGQVEIRYNAPETKTSVREKIGITEKFYDSLIGSKLAALAYRGECGARLDQAFDLKKVTVSMAEDTASEELMYIYIDLEFDKVTLSYELLQIESAGVAYDPVVESTYECAK
jgi:hypothetical protein